MSSDQHDFMDLGGAHIHIWAAPRASPSRSTVWFIRGTHPFIAWGMREKGHMGVPGAFAPGGSLLALAQPRLTASYLRLPTVSQQRKGHCLVAAATARFSAAAAVTQMHPATACARLRRRAQDTLQTRSATSRTCSRAPAWRCAAAPAAPCPSAAWRRYRVARQGGSPRDQLLHSSGELC